MSKKYFTIVDGYLNKHQRIFSPEESKTEPDQCKSIQQILRMALAGVTPRNIQVYDNYTDDDSFDQNYDQFDAMQERESFKLKKEKSDAAKLRLSNMRPTPPEPTPPPAKIHPEPTP